MNEGAEVLSGEVLEAEEKPQRITRNMSETEVKRAAMLTLAENGFGNNAIAKALNRHPVTTSRALTKLRRESLAHPRKLKLASKLSEHVLKECVKPAGQADPRVKMSDGVRMAELVYKASGELAGDREQGPGSGNQTFIQVNNQFFLPDK